jgi:hypothetical protein
MPNWNIFWPFGIFLFSRGNFVYIFPRFGKLCQEKSGNPGAVAKRGKKAIKVC